MPKAFIKTQFIANNFDFTARGQILFSFLELLSAVPRALTQREVPSIAPEVNLDAGQKRVLSLEQKTKATDEINQPIGFLLAFLLSLFLSLSHVLSFFFSFFVHSLYLIHKMNISKQILAVLRSPDGNKKRQICSRRSD